MCDRVTEFKVYNSREVISDALIGSFKFDLGLVYDEVEHCFIHKWLLLVDPHDPNGGTKVKLAVCTCCCIDVSSISVLKNIMSYFYTCTGVSKGEHTGSGSRR